MVVSVSNRAPLTSLFSFTKNRMTKLMYLGIQLSLSNVGALDQASTDAKTEWIAALIPNEKCLIFPNQNYY